MELISWIALVWSQSASVWHKMLMPDDDPEWIIVTTIVIGIVGAADRWISRCFARIRVRY